MFISFAIEDQLRANGIRSLHTGRREQNFPVLCVISADTGERWTISECKPDNRDLAYAVYDAGDSSVPLAGWVSLAELAYARSPRGRLLDIDRSFRPMLPLGQLHSEIRLAGRLPGRPIRH